MNLIAILTSTILAASTIFPFSPEFDVDATQEVTGSLSTTLAISVVSDGDSSNEDEGGSADCTNDAFTWNDTSFARGNAATSTCTRVTFTTGDVDGANITIKTDTGNVCGFMYVDTDNDQTLDTGEVMLKNSGDAKNATNCDSRDDAEDETTTTGSSLHVRAEAIDIDGSQQNSGASGVDCTDVGVYTSNYSTYATSDQTAPTAGSFPSEYLAVTSTAAEILNCTDAMIDASFYVEMKVYVPSTVADGSYEINLTYTITNN